VLDLSFRVEGAEVLPYAAAPSLVFKLRVEDRGSAPIRSIMLRTQIQILPAQRNYSSEERERLYELFGPPAHWSNSLKTMLWANTVDLLPGFSGSTVIDLPVSCTYDFEVATAKYFHGLEEGEVPLEFLFSGSVFYDGETGMQVEQIPWDKEARYRLPVRLWKGMMEQYFPNSAWLRVHREVFDQLYQYKARWGLANWDMAVERLLKAAAGEEVAR
jgi:hypothetical protein